MEHWDLRTLQVEPHQPKILASWLGTQLRAPGKPLARISVSHDGPFLTTGTTVVGEFHCAGCGYGVTVHAKLPRCPMCSGTSWEQAAWSPFSRATRATR